MEIWTVFGYIGGTDSTPASDQESIGFADCSVMASPSPLDRCWVLKDSPATTPLMPAMRAAVEQHWPDVRRIADSVLGDEALAAEIIERAIEEAVAYLADHPSRKSRRCEYNPRAILARRYWASTQATCTACLHGYLSRFGIRLRPMAPFCRRCSIDAEKILRAAPLKVREAIMMRYGSSDSWKDVAAMTATTPAAIRMSCKRFIDRIRRQLRDLGAGH